MITETLIDILFATNLLYFFTKIQNHEKNNSTVFYCFNMFDILNKSANDFYCDKWRKYKAKACK